MVSVTGLAIDAQCTKEQFREKIPSEEYAHMHDNLLLQQQICHPERLLMGLKIRLFYIKPLDTKQKSLTRLSL
jgi:hypothetical protein